MFAFLFSLFVFTSYANGQGNEFFQCRHGFYPKGGDLTSPRCDTKLCCAEQYNDTAFETNASVITTYLYCGNRTYQSVGCTIPPSGLALCCCDYSNCNNERLTTQKLAAHKQYCHASTQTISSLCGHNSHVDPGAIKRCKQEDFACAIDTHILEGSQHLQVDYSCVEKCHVSGCNNDTDGKTHCCCEGQHCNNDTLAADAFEEACRMQQCVKGTKETVACGQQFTHLKASSCDLEHTACSVQMRMETDGMKMTSGCEESCVEDGCRWEGDVYKCCCSEDNCKPNEFAQKALDGHCERQRCVVGSQDVNCEDEHTFKAPSGQSLCQAEQHACGVVAHVVGDSENLKVDYSCVEKCDGTGCKKQADSKTHCCCEGQHCNDDHLAMEAIKEECPKQRCHVTTGDHVACGNRFKTLRASNCDLEHWACSVQMRLETDGVEMTSGCEKSCVEEGCRWEGDVYECCCSEHNCKPPNEFAQKALDGHCERQRCVVGSKDVNCEDKDTFKAPSGQSLCQAEENACGVEAQVVGDSEKLKVDYSCVEKCDGTGCKKQADNKTHCCCKGQRCNDDRLATEAIKDECPKQRCHITTGDHVACGNRFTALRASNCDLEHWACSVQMRLETDGVEMTSGCEKSCVEEGCGWEGDVFKCCCSEHSCKPPNEFAQKALDGHCERQRCVVASQVVSCEEGGLTPEAQTGQSLCLEGENACGLVAQKYEGAAGGEEVKYSCVSECKQDGCSWKDNHTSYTCCCNEHNCNNNQNMTFEAFHTYCAPPTTGQKQIRSEMIGVVFGFILLFIV